MLGLRSRPFKASPRGLEAAVPLGKIGGRGALVGRCLALAGLTIAGVAVKLTRGAPGSGVLPEYYLYLVAFGIGPVLFLVEWARPIINWQAVSFVMLSVLVISIVWEATLGVPYGWWGYRTAPMLGIFIKPWRMLPIESVLVWICVTLTTCVSYEALTAMLVQRARRLR